MNDIKAFDKWHSVSRSDVMPLEDTGIRVNDKSIAAWTAYSKDYEALKDQENTAEGEEFMCSMSSFRHYLEKQNFMEKEQRKLKIGTYSGNSNLQKLHLEEEQKPKVVEAPIPFEIERIKIDDEEEDFEEEEIDLNDAFLEKTEKVESYDTVYDAKDFTRALRMHTGTLDKHKKALWNDCVVFVSNEPKSRYSLQYLRSHAFPDKMYIIKKLNEWQQHMNTLGKQRLAHEMVISNLLGSEFKISNIPYRLDQVQELRSIGKTSGAYIINLVGNKSFV